MNPEYVLYPFTGMLHYSIIMCSLIVATLPLTSHGHINVSRASISP